MPGMAAWMVTLSGKSPYVPPPDRSLEKHPRLFGGREYPLPMGDASAPDRRGERRVGHDGQGDSDGHGLVCGQDGDDADDLAVCAHDAGIPG